MTVTAEQLQDRFRYRVHGSESPKQSQQKQTISEVMLSVAGVLVRTTSPSREQSVALTKLEEAYFWAMASVDRERPGG